MKQNAALVLSGGGAFGVAHVGVLRRLEKNYNFSLYSGVSAGAIVAAAHAVGYRADEISKIIHSQNFFSLGFDFSSSNFGILRGKKIQKLLDEIFGEKTFEDLQKKNITLNIQATDFNTGKIFYFNSGKISTAVMASLSIPLLFEPLLHNDTWLVDGGLSENFPVEFALKNFSQKNKEKIFAIDVATAFCQTKNFSEHKWFGKFSGMQSLLERTFKIFFLNQQKNISNNSRLTIIQPDLEKFKAIDILKLKEIEKAGEKEGEKVLL